MDNDSRSTMRHLCNQRNNINKDAINRTTIIVKSTFGFNRAADAARAAYSARATISYDGAINIARAANKKVFVGASSSRSSSVVS